MTLSFIHWYFNPEVFPNTALPMRWYGILFALAFVAAYLIMHKIFRKEGIAIKTLDDLTLYIGIGTIIGARLGHCLFYEPEIYLREPLRILKIWEGGLASHGAAIGILLALWLFTRKYRYSFVGLLDRLAITIPLSGAIVRLGNLANSEIYGKVTTLPWGFYFHRSAEFSHRFEPHHPTQLYEALGYVLLTLLLWNFYRKGMAGRKGLLFGWFLVLLFALRFLIEFVKEPQVTFEQTMALNMGQLLSIPFIAAGIIIMVYARRKPAVVANLRKDSVVGKEDQEKETTAE
ncbi:MAG TPA: prolipoprotein diacylglyceryl transferase [Bacteroidales bacterium]|nr:prolipoprotein diacylglyceryl transferase [Bacteroidales bacterium]HRZ49201.1 prolipoprotein diacylglyceryl transferase [Bacteroidales bacterium]